MSKDELDRKNLIRESYRIKGITAEECRSIFLDWALSTSFEAPIKKQIQMLLERYESDSPGHPMTRVLRDGLKEPARTGRRGGRKGRVN